MNTRPENMKLYDLTLVNEIARGNVEFVKNLCLVFINSTPPALEEMQEKAALRNWPEVNKLAHKLKSTIDTLNIKEGKLLIREIENYARDEAFTERIPSLIHKTGLLVAEVSAQIREDFNL